MPMSMCSLNIHTGMMCSGGYVLFFAACTELGGGFNMFEKYALQIGSFP